MLSSKIIISISKNDCQLHSTMNALLWTMITCVGVGVILTRESSRLKLQGDQIEHVHSECEKNE